jgi:hypothetical protein
MCTDRRQGQNEKAERRTSRLSSSTYIHPPTVSHAEDRNSEKRREKKKKHKYKRGTSAALQSPSAKRPAKTSARKRKERNSCPAAFAARLTRLDRRRRRTPQSANDHVDPQEVPFPLQPHWPLPELAVKQQPRPSPPLLHRSKSQRQGPRQSA